MIALSICITTRNRATLLAQTIRDIQSQMVAGVELVVVDGASTDDTELVVSRLFAGRDDCRYHRSEAGRGLDRDYDLSVRLARGTYCWMLSDDDRLLEGALRRVLGDLAAAPALLLVNAEVANEDLSELLLPSMLPFRADREFAGTDSDGLLCSCALLLSFIGSVVIRREVWIARHAGDYFGSEFIHVGIIFEAPLPGPALVRVAPAVRVRYGNASWSARTFEVWMFRWPAIIWSLKGVSDEARGRVIPREPWRRPWRLLNMKMPGAYTRETYRRYLKDRPMAPLQRLAAWLLAAIPERPWNCLWRSAYAVLMPGAKFRRFELRKSPFARPAPRNLPRP